MAIFIAVTMLAIAFTVSATTVTPIDSEIGSCIIDGKTIDLAVTKGMSYTVLSEENKTVTVSSKGSADSFTGAVVIPSTIKINEIEYSVTKINPGVFKQTSITKVYVPDTVTIIDGDSQQDNGSFANRVWWRCELVVRLIQHQ